MNDKLYYCVGKPTTVENPSPGISSIKEFLPDTVEEITLFKTKREAFNFMWDKGTIRHGRKDSYNGLFTVKVSSHPDFNSNNEATVASNEITILGAELKTFVGDYQRYQATERGGIPGEMTTQEGVDYEFSLFKKQEVIGHGDDDYEKIRQKMESLFATFNETKSQITPDQLSAWQSVETHTLLLMKSILTKRTSILEKPSLGKILTELACVEKGLNLSTDVLLKPSSENVEQLKNFVEKEAPGKTNYWKIWGGVLLAVAAMGLFALAVGLMGAPAAGFGGGLVVSLLSGTVLSMYGKQLGVAKKMDAIVDMGKAALPPKSTK